MKDLLNFMIKGILGEEKFQILEENKDEKFTYSIQTEDAKKGLIIGKGGRMISSIRNILKVRAAVEKVVVDVEIKD